MKIVKQRAHIIWSSNLSDANKCLASNAFINGAVEYYFWAVKFAIQVPKDMDIAIRDSMNETGCKHTNLMNDVNYLPRKKGGRGLRSLEDSYRHIKIKLAIKLVSDTDERIKVVKEFHDRCKETNSFSFFKDADKYASELKLKMNVNENENNITFLDSATNESISENYKTSSKMLKHRTYMKYHCNIMASSWQGVNLKQRINDEDVIDKYFDWLENWRTCPSDVVQEFILLFYQLLSTKQYTMMRTNEPVEDTRCRICNISEQESIKHLISNCSIFAQGLYTVRHNNALKCFVWPLLQLYGLIEKCPSWYAQDKVAPYYENEKAKFWWDVPEYSGRENEHERPPRPDGKLIVDDGTEKSIFLLEMTVPWTQNRKEKYSYKADKYKNILINLKFENQDYSVDQITIVMDVFGGFGNDLVENISKIFKRKEDVSKIIKNMQKSVIASAANLSRTFKIRSKYCK